jgi:hypothetical protein
VLDERGQYLKLGNHLVDEKRKRTHDTGNYELYSQHDKKLNDH